MRGSIGVNNPLKNGQKLFLEISLLMGVAVSISACRPSVKSACDRLPVLEGELKALRMEMNPYLKIAAQQKGAGKKGRKPASVRADYDSQIPREEWMSHTEDWIKMSQDFRDALHEDDKVNRKALAPLNEASLALVTLHGYIHQGKVTKAVTTLEHVQKNIADFSKKTCNSR